MASQKQATYQNKTFSNAQVGKQQLNAAANNGMRERRNHSIAGYASGLALGTVQSNNAKGEQANNITSPISIVASNSIKNNRLLFKNEHSNEANFQSPTQLGNGQGSAPSQHNNKMNASRGKMQQRYSNYLTQ